MLTPEENKNEEQQNYEKFHGEPDPNTSNPHSFKRFENEKHLMCCNFCGEHFDMRDLSEVISHEHDGTINVTRHHFGTPIK
jgi:hypothetical protein